MNEVKVYPTKAKTETDYFFHVVGTSVSYRYIISECKFQIITHTVIVQEIKVSLTYEEFNLECKKALQRVVTENWGLN